MRSDIARAKVSRGSRWVRAVCLYGAVAMVTVACFILLHHLGNRTPFEIVLQRLTTESEAIDYRWGARHSSLSTHDRWGYCYFSAAALGGSRMTDRSPLHDAILLKINPVSLDTPCIDFKAMLDGTWPESEHEATGRVGDKYWYGSKAIYAIALRHMTVYEFHEALRLLGYASCVLLGCAFALFGWRAFIVGLPIAVFSFLLSGIDHFATIANGLPTIWSLLAPALLAVILATVGHTRAGSTAGRLFCFFAGLTSCFFWMLDSSNFVAVTLIALVAWFAHTKLPLRRRLTRVALCGASFSGGFACAFLINFVSKAIIEPYTYESYVFRLSRLFHRFVEPEPRDLNGRNLNYFLEVAITDVAITEALLTFSTFAMLIALLGVGYRAWRGQPLPILEPAFLLALSLLPLPHFFLPTDDPSRTARLMWLPLALWWGSAIALLTTLRHPYRSAWGLAGSSAVLVLILLTWRHYAGQQALVDMHSARLAVTSRFDVLIQENRLFLYRSECADDDIKSPFELDVWIPDGENQPLYRSFYFRDHRLFSFGASCAALIELPPQWEMLVIGQEGMWWRKVDRINDERSTK